MTTVLNFTPHAIVLIDPDLRGEAQVTLPSSGIARCETIRQRIFCLPFDPFDIPVNRVVFGPVTGLPEPEPETIFIVSAIVANALAGSGRNDLYIVDDTIRNPAGQVVGACALAQIN